MDKGDTTGQNYTPEPSSSSSAKEDSNDGGDLGDTCFFHNKQYPHAPNNLNTPSHHAPSLSGVQPGTHWPLEV